MKLRTILPVPFAGLAIGVLVFLLPRTQVDNELHLERLRRLQAVDVLDVQLNRLVSEARVSSLDSMTDAGTVITRKLGDALDALDHGPRSLRGLSPTLDRALATFIDSMDEKSALAYDFQARNVQLNDRLVQNLDSVPALIEALAAAAPAAQRETVRDLSSRLQTEVLTLGVTPSPSNMSQIAQLLDQLGAAVPKAPASYTEVLTQLHGRLDQVLEDKNDLVGRLKDFLGRPTDRELRAVEQDYLDWHQGQVDTANRYRIGLASYAAALLLGLAWLGLRLRRSYRELDRANAGLLHANEHLEEQVEVRTRDLKRALDELRASQAQLIQSEKMASLGQMVAGIAHEINTPLGYVRSNAGIVRKTLTELRTLIAAQSRALRLLHDQHADEAEVAQALSIALAHQESLDPEPLTEDLDSLLGDAEHGLSQIGELVSGLKDFARVDRSRTDLYNLNEGLEAALKICHNQLKHRIEVVRAYGKLPDIECSPSQLNQVFLNLFTNAAQAIEGRGRIYVHTAAEADGVVVRVLDTGCGMSEEVRARIFEPFFTTKPVGQGTGLGLSIVYRIVEDHGGRIEVRSQPGKGSEFIVRLPLRQARPEAPATTSTAVAA